MHALGAKIQVLVCLILLNIAQCVNAGSLCHIAYGKRTKTEVSRYAYVVFTINVFYIQYFKALPSLSLLTENKAMKGLVLDPHKMQLPCAPPKNIIY